MTLRSWYSRRSPQPANRLTRVALAAAACALLLVCAPKARAGDDAPQWLHALASAPVPAHDEETEAIQLYSETNVSVQSVNNMKTTVRRAYRILRPEGGAKL